MGPLDRTAKGRNGPLRENAGSCPLGTWALLGFFPSEVDHPVLFLHQSLPCHHPDCDHKENCWPRVCSALSFTSGASFYTYLLLREDTYQLRCLANIFAKRPVQPSPEARILPNSCTAQLAANQLPGLSPPLRPEPALLSACHPSLRLFGPSSPF